MIGMRIRYIIYPQAQERLESSGISQRIKDAYDQQELRNPGMLYDGEVIGMIDEMRQSGIFKNLTKEESKGFEKKMQKWFSSMGEHRWKVERVNGQLVEEASYLEDLLGMVGWWNYVLLNPEDVFNYQKYGFDNITDFTGSVAASVTNVVNKSYRKGYDWKTETEDGKILESEITGDSNADLRIYRGDITPYQTIDPIGNQVSFRPELYSDRETIVAHHSTEDFLLVAILNWITQCDIKTKYVEDKFKRDIESGQFLEQMDKDVDVFRRVPEVFKIRMALIQRPLPMLNENNECEDRSTYALMSNSDYHYGLYIGNNRDLVFTLEDSGQNPGKKKQILTRFSQEEADHLIQGLICQGSRGLGRISYERFMGIINYRLSEQYKKDLEEFGLS